MSNGNIQPGYTDWTPSHSLTRYIRAPTKHPNASSAVSQLVDPGQPSPASEQTVCTRTGLPVHKPDCCCCVARPLPSNGIPSSSFCTSWPLRSPTRSLQSRWIEIVPIILPWCNVATSICRHEIFQHFRLSFFQPTFRPHAEFLVRTHRMYCMHIVSAYEIYEAIMNKANWKRYLILISCQRGNITEK